MLLDVGAIVGAVFGSQVVAGVVQSVFNKRKFRAEADATALDAAIKYTDAITRRVEKLEADLELMRRENLQLNLEVGRLKTELNLYQKLYGESGGTK